MNCSDPTKVDLNSRSHRPIPSPSANANTGRFAVLPQFIGVEESVLATTLFFATLDAGIAMLALSLYTTVALGAGALLRRPAARRAVDRISGAVLVVLGIRLAASFP